MYCNFTFVFITFELKFITFVLLEMLFAVKPLRFNTPLTLTLL